MEKNIYQIYPPSILELSCPHTRDRTDSTCPVPDAITATEPVGCTWDEIAQTVCRPMPPCLMPLQQPKQLDEHGTRSHRQFASPFTHA
ncbi:hypothetical protein AVEN_48787-1 [Araneus ventricosus]|uniref:Uncharacterized protein n=1 Tax=Araneus ventricosus TaxID=182803 RepID=A0A4Y2LSV3_ARAVE|nr:hypothetical protein AVEN_48787-1 [Araneus ventricosus]